MNVFLVKRGRSKSMKKHKKTLFSMTDLFQSPASPCLPLLQHSNFNFFQNILSAIILLQYFVFKDCRKYFKNGFYNVWLFSYNPWRKLGSFPLVYSFTEPFLVPLFDPYTENPNWENYTPPALKAVL